MSIQNIYYTVNIILTAIIFIAMLWNFDKVFYGARRRRADRLSRIEEKLDNIEMERHYQQGVQSKRK